MKKRKMVMTALALSVAMTVTSIAVPVSSPISSVVTAEAATKTAFTGLKKVGSNWYYYTNGKKVTKGTDVVKNSKGWWYTKNGKVDFTYNGLAKNKNGWWAIKKGKVDFSFQGIMANASGSWYLEGGKVIFSFSGTFSDGTYIYTIKNGKVVSKEKVSTAVITVDKKNVKLASSEVKVQDDTVLVSTKALTKTLGIPAADITVADGTVVVDYANTEVTFTIGSKTAQAVKSGIVSDIDLTAAPTADKATYVPLAALAEAVGYKAEVSGKKVTISTKMSNVVTTKYGKLAGVETETEGVVLYKGVPYATAERWAAPEEPEKWDGVMLADTFSAICPQSTYAYGDFQKEFYDDPYPQMSEDCLYLNVWAPKDAKNKKYPVMVYIHGGGNGGGWSYEKEFDGEAIAEQGVILVTINYRISTFGFLALEEFEDENGASGNWGLRDQIAALEWVQNNIKAFGGDPKNVTMFGQSAGAFDVTILSCSDKVEGLVSKAIIQSDYQNYANSTTLEQQEAAGAKAVEKTGYSLDELKEMDACELYDVMSAVDGWGDNSYAVCADGYVLTDTAANIFDRGEYLDIQYMSGSNESEGASFVNSKIVLAEKQLELGRRPAYTYLFSHFMPGVDDPSSTCYGSFHTSECWYIFNTLDRCWRQPLFDETDYAVQKMMTAYWTNFAKTGNPNGKGLKTWEAYTADNKNVEDLDITMEELGIDEIVVNAAKPIDVSGGQITGIKSEDEEVVIYKGVPYAAAPVGELRWKEPQDVEAWTGVKACSEFAACAVQNYVDFSMPWMGCYSQEWCINAETDTISEDCLYLNVWTQNGRSDAKKPVIVYIHGGGYGEGSGSIKGYDGEAIAKDGAVFVNINYRLGVFGFLTHPDLDAESETGSSGNYGLYDTVKALEWIQDNIAQFGGDPDNVTIVGQSAGGMSISTMMQSPLAAGLFKNAVILSGNYIRAGRASTTQTKVAAQAAFLASYGDISIEELRAMSTEEVFSNYKLSGNVCVDGVLIPEQTTETLAAGRQNAANVLLSTVEGDIGVFDFFSNLHFDTVEEYNTWIDENLADYAEEVKALYPCTEDSEAQAAIEQINIDRQMMSYYCFAKLNEKMGMNTYIDFFTHALPSDKEEYANEKDHFGAFHTSDVAYWLGTYVERQSATDMDERISNNMQNYLVNFAATGDPNGKGTPAWTKYDGSYSYLHIGEDTYDKVDIPADKGDFWLQYYNETSLGGAL